MYNYRSDEIWSCATIGPMGSSKVLKPNVNGVNVYAKQKHPRSKKARPSRKHQLYI